MNVEDRGHSLADDAAAWVPPWARTPAAESDVDDWSRESDVDDRNRESDVDAAGVMDSAADDSTVDDDLDIDADLAPAALLEESTVDDSAAAAAEPDMAVLVDVGRADADTAGVVETSTEIADLDPAELRGALEAILLVVDEPIGEVMLAQVLEQPTDVVVATLGELAAEYADTARGFELRRLAGGWRLYTRSRFSSYVERFVLDGQQVRLTQAALETLAVVAYKQPVTRARISAIRGVNCDGVIRTLVSRGLIEECGSEPDSGAYLYRTTTLFLEKLGLDSTAELPPLAPFLPDDMDEIDAQH